MFSIIVPIYNAQSFLNNCISQLLSQTFSDFELILVNDGSKDKSGEICDLFAASDNRIKVIHTQNHGASTARNIGLSYACRELITFIDADDEIDINYVYTLYRDFIVSANPDFLIQGMIQKWPDHEIRHILPNGTYNLGNDDAIKFFNNIFLNDFSGPYCKIFKRSIINTFNIRFSQNIIYGEDFDFILRYLLHCKNVVTSSVANYLYIMHGDSVSSKYYDFNMELSGLQQIHASFDSLLKKFDYESLHKMKSCSLIPYFWRLIYANYKHGYNKNTRICHLKSIPDYEIQYLKNNYNPTSVFTKIVKLLISTNQITVLDLILHIRLTLLKNFLK